MGEQHPLPSLNGGRAGELERAGYDLSAASVLAASSAVDLHFAIDLLSRGCPQDTAMQILL